MTNEKTLIVNLFAGPGAGKSTLASGIFYHLKMQSLNCEMVREYAKDKVWEENFTALDAQLYIASKQYYRQRILKGKVDAMISDSPLLFSILYNQEPDEELRSLFNNFILVTFKKQNNLNFFIKRKKVYVQEGRIQTKEEALIKDEEVLDLLNKNDISYYEVDGTPQGLDRICKIVMSKLAK